ncbi:MAG: FMN-binding protein [Nitrospirae bacterium]|nr:FMN-binding protein [Nitrospirota bacterium]
MKRRPAPFIGLFICVFGVALLAWAPGSDAHQKGWPGKRLSQTFPEAAKFTSRQVTLSAAQIAAVEEKLGERLEAESRTPTFYSALDKAGTKIGFVLFADQTGELGAIEMGVAVDSEGKVRHVVVFSSRENRGISKEDFLDQFHGKAVADLLKVGEDIIPVVGAEKATHAVANGVRKVLLIKQSVFGDQNP